MIIDCIMRVVYRTLEKKHCITPTEVDVQVTGGVIDQLPAITDMILEKQNTVCHDMYMDHVSVSVSVRLFQYVPQTE